MTKIPASIRYNNPGAMWGRLGRRTSEADLVATNYPLAMRWGSIQSAYLADGLGQGNNAAIFPTKVQGAAAQFDLWRTKYVGMTLLEATTKWSGGNSSPPYVAFLTQHSGVGPDDLISPAMLAAPRGLALMMAQARWEAAGEYPMSDAEWASAQRLVFTGIAKPAAPVVAAAKPAPPRTSPPPPTTPSPAPTGFWGRLAAAFVRNAKSQNQG